MHKRIIYILSLIFFITSCETMQTVKRGLTGEKENSTDEFFIKKKDPLILPPDFEDLPSPDNAPTESAEAVDLEKSLGISIEEESTETGSSSAENSILKKIRSK
tara:strand:- start:184 stop:495 length:312 start_codon:yes stop_codon:yes gene_type:complete